MDDLFYTIGAILVIFVIAAVVFLALAANTGSNTDGTAIDTIARVSSGGWVWQTWRVELTNDHPISDGSGGYIAQQYAINKNSKELIDMLQKAADSGKKVKIYYHSYFITWKWDYCDADVIYKVEVI